MFMNIIIYAYIRVFRRIEGYWRILEGPLGFRV